MDIEIIPSELGGSVSIPSSKSVGHRAIICAALARGKSRILNVDLSDDIERTLNAIKIFGAEVSFLGKDIYIDGSNIFASSDDIIIDCFESGSTLRFLIPLSLLYEGKTTFTGTDRLASRSILPYIEIFSRNNIEFLIAGGDNLNRQLPFMVTGGSKSISDINLVGSVSSQFITGLLFILPFLPCGTVINVTSNLESKSYVDISLKVLQSFGVYIHNESYSKFYIEEKQSYESTVFFCENDFSQAAFFLVAGIIGSKAVCCRGLNLDSVQGDKEIVNIIRRMGGHVECEGNSITAFPSDTFCIEIDARDIPDLVPILTVLAAFSTGVTKIYNVSRLRIKESDRLEAISSQLCILGASVIVEDDILFVKGNPENINGGRVTSFNDHRIAMSLAIASSRCNKSVFLENAECVKKSYPGFWDDFKSIGGRLLH